MKLLRSVQLTQELRAAAQFLTEALQQCAARSEASKQQRGLAMEDELVRCSIDLLFLSHSFLLALALICYYFSCS